MKIYVLGAAGWIPGVNETSCLMVEHKNALFLLDAGTGISNLGKYQSVLKKYDTVNIILSHYHLDHTIGMIYLLPYLGNKKLRVFGPGKMAYPHTTREYLHELLRKEFFSRAIDDFAPEVELLDFPGSSFRIDGTQITVQEQRHSAPSYRICMDNLLIYATDTVFEEKTWNGVRAGILFHECWDYSGTLSGKHTTLRQLQNQLPRTQFGRIVLIHQNPSWTEQDMHAINTEIRGSNFCLATDGMMFIISDTEPYSVCERNLGETPD